MATNKKVVVGGKTVDIEKLEELAQLQAQLLPDNWPIAKREGVRLFLNTQEMAVHEFKRHLARNYRLIVKVALEQQAENEGAEVTVGFSFDLNFSALSVAAIGKNKMSFSQKFSSEGKPKAHDINQGDFMGELSEELDPASLAREEEEDRAAEEEEEKEFAAVKAEKAMAGKSKGKKDTD